MSQTTTCPGWCTAPHVGDDWEVTSGRLVRSHCGGGWQPIQAADGFAELFVRVEETIEGDFDSTVVTVVADNLRMTPAQARAYAYQLLAAADLAEGGPGQR